MREKKVKGREPLWGWIKKRDRENERNVNMMYDVVDGDDKITSKKNSFFFITQTYRWIK